MLLTGSVEPLLEPDVPVFTGDDGVEAALFRMRQGGIVAAPLLQDGHFKAMITPEILESMHDHDKRLGDIPFESIETIDSHDHLFDVIPRLQHVEGELLPVRNSDGHYVGVVRKSVLFQRFAELFHLDDGCYTLELMAPAYNLKLSEVIAVFEKNGATVLGFSQYSIPSDHSSVLLAFRVQTHDFFRLVLNLEKYHYHISYSTPPESGNSDLLRDKADALLRFMEI